MIYNVIVIINNIVITNVNMRLLIEGIYCEYNRDIKKQITVWLLCASESCIDRNLYDLKFRILES